MSDFNLALPTIIQHEGDVFTDNPNDPGGATKFGLTLSFIQGMVDSNFTVAELEDMHLDEATSIYLKYWWNKYNLGSIQNQELATKVFDTLVNLGPSGGTKQIQKACNETHIPTDIDGNLGPATITALNKKPLLILNNIKNSLVSYYKTIVSHNPDESQFLKGWLTRAQS